MLQQAAEEGHCFLPEPELTERVVKRLALPDSPVDPVRIGELINEMAEEKQLITQLGYGDLADQNLCYAPAFYYTEQALASRLAAFARATVTIDLTRVKRWIDRYTEKRDMTLSEEQRRAVELAASSRLWALYRGTRVWQDVHDQNSGGFVACDGEVHFASSTDRTGCATALRDDRAGGQNHPPHARF